MTSKVSMERGRQKAGVTKEEMRKVRSNTITVRILSTYPWGWWAGDRHDRICFQVGTDPRQKGRNALCSLPFDCTIWRRVDFLASAVLSFLLGMHPIAIWCGRFRRSVLFLFLFSISSSCLLLSSSCSLPLCRPRDVNWLTLERWIWRSPRRWRVNRP